MLFNIPLNEEVVVKVEEDEHTTQTMFVNRQGVKHQKNEKEKEL